MDLTPVMLTTLGGALSATLGVLVGGAVTRRAHLDRRGVDVDWAAWSAALTSAGLVAPLEVARALDQFAKGVAVFLGRVATRDPQTNPVDEKGLTEASRPAAAAHLALLNAIRRSLGRSLEEMPFYLSGTLGEHAEGFDRG